MEREAGINVVEKKRLRDAIQDQIRQYLERGGSITVISSQASRPAKAPQGGVWTGGADIMAQLD
ncbi:MAG: hypothetical protein V2I24_07900 [Halieaceae bacterium]|jgi:hypothetical protein|nr:hypothetical protein [Halieaceae bacterium]